MSADGNPYRFRVETAATWLSRRINSRPRIGLLTGTGLGESLQAMRVEKAFDYEQIPHFPIPTVPSHRGRFLVGEMGGAPTVALEGRLHLYEGYTPLDVTFPVRVMQRLGIESLILTNAAGGVNPTFLPGDIMLVTDHINLTGDNPLVGPNEDHWGDRFPDMGNAYDRSLVDQTQAVAAKLGICGVKRPLSGNTGRSPVFTGDRR